MKILKILLKICKTQEFLHQFSNFWISSKFNNLLFSFRIFNNFTHWALQSPPGADFGLSRLDDVRDASPLIVAGATVERGFVASAGATVEWGLRLLGPLWRGRLRLLVKVL